MRANQLNAGQIAEILEIEQSEVGKKLAEMGCVPGAKIELKFVAPFGDPLAFELDGYVLALRSEEASKISVQTALD